MTSLLALAMSAILVVHPRRAAGAVQGKKESGAASAPQGETSGESEGGKEAVSAEAGSIAYPLNSDKKVRWYAQDNNKSPHEKFADASESPFHIGLAEKLGVDIEWMFPTTGSDGTTFTTTLLADPTNLPDIMNVYWMNNANQYIEDGIIWDLTDYIQEYAPDYYAWLQTDPAYDRAMKTDDGRYYAFGFSGRTEAGMTATRGLWSVRTG